MRPVRDVKELMDFPASRLQAEFGLSRAIVVGLHQQACTGMPGSLRVAGALLSTEPGWRRVLCVTADRFPPGAWYEQAYNLISDGGAACVVGRDPAPFRLLTVHQITNGGLAMAGDDEMMFAVPADKVVPMVNDLIHAQESGLAFVRDNMMMKSDFPHPELYKTLFRSWGMYD